MDRRKNQDRKPTNQSERRLNAIILRNMARKKPFVGRVQCIRQYFYGNKMVKIAKLKDDSEDGKILAAEHFAGFVNTPMALYAQEQKWFPWSARMSCDDIDDLLGLDESNAAHDDVSNPSESYIEQLAWWTNIEGDFKWKKNLYNGYRNRAGGNCYNGRRYITNRNIRSNRYRFGKSARLLKSKRSDLNGFR